MFVWMIYNKAPEETKILSDISSNVIAHLTGEETKLFCVKRALEAKRLLEREQIAGKGTVTGLCLYGGFTDEISDPGYPCSLPAAAAF